MQHEQRGALTVLVAGVGAGALQCVEVLGEHGQVGLRRTLVVLWVWRLLHHLLDLLYHLTTNRHKCVHACVALHFRPCVFCVGHLQPETVLSCIISLSLVSAKVLAPPSEFSVKG